MIDIQSRLALKILRWVASLMRIFSSSFAQLGNVARHRHQAFAPVDDDDDRGEQAWNHPPIARPKTDFHVGDAAFGLEAANELFRQRRIGPHVQFSDGLADHLLAPKARDAKEMLVHVLNAAGGQIDQRDTIGVGIEELAQRTFAFKDGPLRFLILAHEPIAQIAGEIRQPRSSGQSHQLVGA